MFRAMAVKELREVRGIVLVALVAYALVIAGAAYPKSPANLFSWFTSSMSEDYLIPFVSDNFVGRFFLVSVVFAIALGLRQTVGESVHGTYLFLLHRPASRRWLIGVKLAVGATVGLAVMALPVAVYGLWAATPGTHASPFAWSMTVSTWVGWFSMTAIYFGAFHSGIRPARWFRSRLVPLAAAGMAVFATVVLASEFEGTLWPCSIVLASDLWLVAMILFSAWERDYA